MEKKLVKAVIVTMFQPEGDGLGELMLFRDRLEMEKLSLPETGLEDVYWSEKSGILVFVAGVGTANTAISILSLLRTNMFSFTEALWLIVGIAGGNPNTCSLGSVVLCDYCVDADLAFEIDPRELPAEWETGIFPLGAKEPYGPSSFDPAMFGRPYQSFALNQNLLQQAYNACLPVLMQDGEELSPLRTKYAGFAGGEKVPELLIGSCLTGARFWHGVLLNRWAEKWVAHYSDDKGVFMASAMEDTGTLLALQQAATWGEVKKDNILLIRAISNFTMPPHGVDPIENLMGGEEGDHYPAFRIALENGFAVAMKILDELL